MNRGFPSGGLCRWVSKAISRNEQTAQAVPNGRDGIIFADCSGVAGPGERLILVNRILVPADL